MPHLIIGDTTETSVRVWVRGDKKHTRCEVSLSSAIGDRATIAIRDQAKTLTLLPEKDYTGTLDFAGLAPGTTYAVEANFGQRNPPVPGRVRTMPRLPVHEPHSFSFILSSCNLSVVSINNFLSLLAATAGTSLASTSLDLPAERWRVRLFDLLQNIVKRLLKLFLVVIAWFINEMTGLKQPGPPYVRSPFIKLSAVFESWVLDINSGPGTGATSGDWYLAVGDRVGSAGGAVGRVASTEVVSRPAVAKTAGTDAQSDRGVRAAPEKCRVVCTEVQGEFKKDETFDRIVTANSHESRKTLGKVSSAAPGLPWYSRPSFFLHAGDQIYFDFPNPSREPKREQYRLAYQEAWFEDEPLRYLLAHWPHYMTLDDHEIADQFAKDFVTPNKNFKPDQYLEEGGAAYRDYAHALSAPTADYESTAEPGPFWYTFQKGCGHFFVLDTRTRRCNAKPAMIDDEQMRQLLRWMLCHKRDLKFIVTSVPFVAEVNAPASNEKIDWFKESETTPKSELERNSEQDKWSAYRFRTQRHQIIEYIAENSIERIVFLTGDMHCCYHATMRIGPVRKKNESMPIEPAATAYESLTVHELAGGPVNQLQLAKASEFDRRCKKRTREGGVEGVEYEVRLERFHGDGSAVMHIEVNYLVRDEVTNPNRALVPEVEWNVIRTLTDPEPRGWTALDDAAGGRSHQFQSGESVMAGRIAFVKPRSPDQLDRW